MQTSHICVKYERKRSFDNNMYHNYTPQFLWAGVSKHEDDSSLNSTPKTTRSSEPCQIVIKKKVKRSSTLSFFLDFFFFHIQYASLIIKKRQCLRASPEIRIPVLL